LSEEIFHVESELLDALGILIFQAEVEELHRKGEGWRQRSVEKEQRGESEKIIRRTALSNVRPIKNSRER
jgi:hypothetical protein